MRRSVLTIVIGMVLVSGCATPADDASPHAAALQLVMQKCGNRIRAAEIANAAPAKASDEPWWFDTQKREWTVRRPFGPGMIDSTHVFDVIYSIDGKVAAAWLVDTRAGTVLEPSRELHP